MLVKNQNKYSVRRIYFSSKRLGLLTSIAIFILIIYNIVILKNHIPDGYNVSIYNQFPINFWCSLVLIYFLATYQILKIDDAAIQLANVLILVLNHYIFLIAPYFLQYYSMNDTDTLTNIGQLRELFYGFHIGADNIYPATHIIFSCISNISGISPILTANMSPTIFSLIFILGQYTFSRLLIYEADARRLIVPILTIFYFRGYYFIMSPNYVYMMLLPIYLYVIYRYLSSKNKSGFSVALTLMIMIIPFAHPFVFMFICYLFIISSILTKFSLAKISETDNVLLLLNVMFLFWLVTNYILLDAAGGIINNILNSAASFTVLEGTHSLESGIHKLPIIIFIIFVSLIYGRFIFPLAFVLFAFIILIKDKHMRTSEGGTYRNIFVLSLIFGFVDFFMLFNPIINHTFERITTLNFIYFALLPLFGYSLYNMFLKRKKRILVITAILTFILSFSLFGSHESTYTFTPNEAITYNEVVGMNWILDKKNISYPIINAFNSQAEYRFHDTLFGSSHRPKYNNEIRIMPDHLGYNNTDTEFILNGMYIIISTPSYFVDVFFSKLNGPHRFSSQDFEKLRVDPRASKVYDSLNIDIYEC